ncbi:MAG: LPD38 domain-containing protein, partial [Elusimicrobiota bacterium]
TLAELIQSQERRTGAATGLRPDDIVKVVKEYESELFNNTLKKLNKYQHNLVDYLVHRDMLTPEAAENIKETYSFHLPLYRLFEGGDEYFGGTGGNKYANLPNPLKRAYGSTRIIKDPIRNIIRDTVYIIRQADKNRIALSTIKAIEKKQGTGQLVEDVPLPKEMHQFALEQVKKALKEAGLEDSTIETLDLETIATVFESRQYAGIKEARENVVFVRDKGEIKAKQLHPELYDFIQNSGVQMPEALEKIFSVLEVPANIFKIGAVFSPRFWKNNLGRDELREMVYRENGIQKLNLFKTVIDGMGALTGLSKDETEALFKAAGGARAGFFGLLDDLDDPETLDQLLKSNKISKNPLDWLAAASRWTEDIRRKGFFIENLEGVDLGKLIPEEFEKIILESAYISRGQILEDYGIKGTGSRVINRLLPFFSARFTGTRHFYNQMKNKPLLSLLKGFAFITLPSIMLYMQNRNKPEYQELPNWRKMFFFHHITDKGTIIPFPKPFLPGYAFGGIPELMMNYMDKKDPKILTDGLKNIARFGLPGPQPAHIIPYLEVMFNKKLSGSPIDPENEQLLEPEEKYSQWTSEPAKLMGKAINVSPRKIDHLIRGQFASLGNNALEISKSVTERRGFFESLNAIMGFTNEPYMTSISIDKVYRERDKAQTTINTFEKQVRSGGTQYTREEVRNANIKNNILSNTTRQLSNLRKIENSVDKADAPDDLKENAKTYLNIQQINIARQSLSRINPDEPNTQKINPANIMEPVELMRIESFIKNLEVRE